MSFFLFSQKNYVGDNKSGKSYHFIHKGFEENIYKCRREYLDSSYRLFASISIGREFVVIVKIKS